MPLLRPGVIKQHKHKPLGKWKLLGICSTAGLINDLVFLHYMSY